MKKNEKEGEKTGGLIIIQDGLCEYDLSSLHSLQMCCIAKSHPWDHYSQDATCYAFLTCKGTEAAALFNIFCPRLQHMVQ